MREPLGNIKVADLVMLALTVAVVAAMWGDGSAINAASTNPGQLLIIGGDTGGNLTDPYLGGSTARNPFGLFDNSTNAVVRKNISLGLEPRIVLGDSITSRVAVVLVSKPRCLL